MSLVPSDSVSRQGESKLELEGSGLCSFTLNPPVYPSADLATLIGPARYVEQLQAYNKQMASYYAAYQSYCRTVLVGGSSSGASHHSSSLSDSSGGFSNTFSRADSGSAAFVGGSGSSSVPGRMGKNAVRGLSRRMRAKGVSRGLPGGYCYARAIRPEARESVAMALGSYPALGDLLARPREEFMSPSATESLSVAVGPTGVAHVDYVSPARPLGPARFSFNSCVSRIAGVSEFGFGSYGHMLRVGSPVPGPDETAGLLSLETPVGGLGDFPYTDVFSHEGGLASSVLPVPFGARSVVLSTGRFDVLGMDDFDGYLFECSFAGSARPLFVLFNCGGDPALLDEHVARTGGHLHLSPESYAALRLNRPFWDVQRTSLAG